jgi:hypothetical protein
MSISESGEYARRLLTPLRYREGDDGLLDWMNRQEVLPCRCMSTYAWTVARKLCSR